MMNILYHALWLFQGDYLPHGLGIALLGALGPRLARARGARLLWVCAGVIWLITTLVVRLSSTEPGPGANMPGFSALCLGLVALATLLLARSKWSLGLQTFVGLLVAFVLPNLLALALLALLLDTRGVH